MGPVVICPVVPSPTVIAHQAEGLPVGAIVVAGVRGAAVTLSGAPTDRAVEGAAHLDSWWHSNVRHTGSL